MARGYIKRQYVICCGRCDFQEVGDPKIRANTFATSHGWVHSRKEGWLCPECVAKRSLIPDKVDNQPKGVNSDEVIRLFALGWRQVDIAKYLKVSRQRISQIQLRHGISARDARKKEYADKKLSENIARMLKPRHNLSPKTIRILNKYRDGVLVAQIAKEEDIALQTVSNLVRRYIPSERRSPRRSQYATKPIRDKIYALADKGYKAAQIAKKLGEDGGYVYNVLRARKQVADG